MSGANRNPRWVDVIRAEQLISVIAISFRRGRWQHMHWQRELQRKEKAWKSNRPGVADHHCCMCVWGGQWGLAVRIYSMGKDWQSCPETWRKETVMSSTSWCFQKLNGFHVFWPIGGEVRIVRMCLVLTNSQVSSAWAWIHLLLRVSKLQRIRLCG